MCAKKYGTLMEKTIDAVTSALQKMLNDGLFTHESSALNPQFNDENKEEVCEA